LDILASLEDGDILHTDPGKGKSGKDA